MNDRAVLVLNSIKAREQACGWARRLPNGTIVEFRKPNRTLEQNARMWAMLHDISKQVDWYGETLSPEDWKTVFTAGLKKSKAVPGIDGGFVVLGLSTSKMTRPEFSELMALIEAFGAEKGVEFTAAEEERHTRSNRRMKRIAGVS